MEFKALQTKSKIDGRVVTGVFSVLGNRDAAGDRIMPGAFTKTFSEQKQRARHLWNHDGFAPPIAKIKELVEVGRNDLPTEVLALAPDAIGAAIVTREYLDTPRGNEVFEGVKAGAIEEMSFAFSIPKNAFEFREEEVNGEKIITRFVREVRLFDTSDVNWGCNDATLAVRSLPAETLALSLKTLLTEFKSGRRNSAADESLIKTIHDTAVELGAICAPEANEEEKSEKAKETIVEVFDLSEAKSLVATMELLQFEFAL